MKNIKFGFDDVNIVPEPITSIRHRSDCNVDTENLFFASPMSSVVSYDNLNSFIDNGITPIIPRTYPLDERIKTVRYFSHKTYFVAFSLREVREALLSKEETIVGVYDSAQICIDVANGHMAEVIDTIKGLKQKYGDRMVVMAGNIANPKAYKAYDEAGCDYVRCGIGGGSGCLTASNTGVFYPLFSLLKETYEVKKKIGGKCKIIADGGIRGYRDIQLALLYADSVMMGGLFNKAIESAGKTTYGKSYFVTRTGKRYLNIFRTLLEYGCDFNKGSRDERTYSHMKIGKLNEGNTPLMIACWQGLKRFAEQLCALPGISLNQQDSNGYTALIKCAVQRYNRKKAGKPYAVQEELYRYLISKGADQLIRDRNNETAQDWWEKGDQLDEEA